MGECLMDKRHKKLQANEWMERRLRVCDPWNVGGSNSTSRGKGGICSSNEQIDYMVECCSYRNIRIQEIGMRWGQSVVGAVGVVPP